jgi:hypothetical protein
VAAPRRYSDQQRAAMFRLYEAGKSPADIARLCEEGTAGTSPFTIPRRTVHDIVTRMAAEAELKLPASVAEAESADAVERYPVRIAHLVDAEITRFTAKQEKGGLGPRDYDCLSRAADLSFTLHRRLSQRRPSGPRRPGSARERAGAEPRPESAMEKLARQEAEAREAEAHLSCTHAPPGTADPGQPDDTPNPAVSVPHDSGPGGDDDPGAGQDVATEQPTAEPHAGEVPAADPASIEQPVTRGSDVDRAVAEWRAKATPALRAEAAQKAQAALRR